MKTELINSFLSKLPEICIRNSNSQEFSYWKIGGPVALLVEPQSIAQLATSIRLIHEHPNDAGIVIGDGSNLLFDSAGFNGVIVKIGNGLSKYTIEGTKMRCEAGLWVPELAYRLSELGLSGIEHICGIPGRIGGLVYMNGGSNRRSILENTISVELINSAGEIETVYATDLEYAYRTSPFQNDGRIVAAVTLQLEKDTRKAVRSRIKAILESRRKKFPRKLPNCGSVFLSDPAMYDQIGPPGFAIEKVGLKGLSKGHAQLSPIHANFIVNNGGAKSADVLYLIALARSKVFEDTKFIMDCEARYISPDGEIVQAHKIADEQFSELYSNTFFEELSKSETHV